MRLTCPAIAASAWTRRFCARHGGQGDNSRQDFFRPSVSAATVSLVWVLYGQNVKAPGNGAYSECRTALPCSGWLVRAFLIVGEWVKICARGTLRVT
jgi:hypothetical protein